MMRQRNMRMILTGGVLLVLAVGFFLFMMSIAGKSTDPKALMTTVGQVSGVVTAISVAMIVFGFIGRKTET